MNTLLTIESITYEALRVLTNALTFTGLVNRQFDNAFGKSGAKVGDVIYARKPPRYTIRKGAGIQPQATTETRQAVKMDSLVGIDLPFSGVERTLSLDNYSDRVLKPALATIANQIDWDGLQLYKEVYNMVGTPGTTPTSTTCNEVYLGAGTKLDDMAAPQDERRALVVTPSMHASAVSANSALFNPQQIISDSFRKGRFGRQTLGFDWYMDQNCPTHTTGSRTGTNGATWQTYGADQTGSTFIIDGFTTGDTIKKGDVFTIGTIAAGTGVQSVNPQNRQATGSLQQFTVLADVTSTGATESLSISPPITPSGQFQTVDRSPANDAVITFAAASGKVYREGMAFHRDAFTLVTAPLELPKGVHEASYAGDEDTGVGIRIVTAFDIRTNEMITRFDALYGWACLRPELACRIASAA
jgi:hypothetical protein